MDAIEACGTAELGGHVEECDAWGHVRIFYDSCRNRHCPKCQLLEKERWLVNRKEDLLPVRYFHVVFTLPEGSRPIALRNPKEICTLLFKTASQTLLSWAPKYLGAEIGLTALLHTWTRTLLDHPHLHCIVTGGGLAADGKQWKKSRQRFLLHILPDGFMKIRRYGIVCNRHRRSKLARCKELL